MKSLTLLRFSESIRKKQIPCTMQKFFGGAVQTSKSARSNALPSKPPAFWQSEMRNSKTKYFVSGTFVPMAHQGMIQPRRRLFGKIPPMSRDNKVLSKG